jgi:hypothetical protein
MPHHHLTAERYELALEEDASRAARLRRQAEGCSDCAAALAALLLAPRLAAWVAPDSLESPVDWERALRRAVAPSAQRPRRRRWARPARLAVVAVLLVGLTLATALPAAAGAGPGSALYPVRGLEEDTRWALTPLPERAAWDADLASAYLWQARTSAARRDGLGYGVAMQRFFKWAERLQADIGKAPPAQRTMARESFSAGRSVVSPLTTSGPDPEQARRAQSVIDDVEVESARSDGQHHDGQGQGGSQQGSSGDR